MNEKAIRVLAVVNSLDYGGTERMLERMVLALHEPGRLEFTVCSLGGVGPIGQRLRARGIEVIALGTRGGVIRVVGHGAIGIRRLLRRGRFDLIHSFLPRSNCAARLAQLGLKRRAVLISSERSLGDTRAPGTSMMNRLTHRMSNRVVAVSAAVRDRIVERDRIPPGKVTVILNGIEIAAPRPATGTRLRKRLGIAPSEVVILALGRLHREKGPDLLLRALGALSDRPVGRWRALLVGDGPEREPLRRLAAALGIQDRVVFAGARRRVGPWIEAADLLVLPSREEGLPVAPLEAMARGKPVIATDVGGTPEVVQHGETGLLVPAEDPRALAAGLQRLLEDPALRVRLGVRGLAVLRAEFSIERMVGQIAALYEELLGRRPAQETVGQAALLRASGE